MKKILILLFILIGLQSVGQKMLSPKLIDVQRPDKAKTQRSIKGISPLTAMLLVKLKAKNSFPNDIEKNRLGNWLTGDSSIFKEYGIITKNNVHYVNAFILVSESFRFTDLEALGFLPGTTSNTIVTGLVPVDQIEMIANHPNVKYLSAGERANPTMDSAANKTQANLVHLGFQLSQPYFGDGVVVGIVDKGFDYTHPNYFDGNTTISRVKRVWEQLSAGTPPAGFNYGRELATQAGILTAARDNTTDSHGTHVSGIAAGSGGANTTFRGIAPNADIVLVSTDGNSTKLYEGIIYIMNYANSVNKPCVINLSWGGHFGPHDGTSLFDRATDNIAGQGKIIVGSAGNSGLDSIYLEKTYSGNDTILYSFIKFPRSSITAKGKTIIDIWGEPNMNFKVAINIYDTYLNQFISSTGYYPANINSENYDTLADNDVFTLTDLTFTRIITEKNPINNKSHAVIEINNELQDDEKSQVLLEILGTNTQTKAWICSGDYDYAIFSAGDYTGSVKAGSTNSTVSEIGGTGNAMVSVGAYTAKNNYTALNGTPKLAFYNVSVGTIAPFSSKGPTADGRTKPDITAPGNVVISAVNSFDNSLDYQGNLNYSSASNNVVSSVTNGTKTWYYGSMQGTSQAAPMVTGIIALWLQANPNLTPAQIKTYLKDGSIMDAVTGSIPTNGSNTWGWGKIDAYSGLTKVTGADTYTFSGNGNWNVASNWTNNLIPPNPLTSGLIIIDHAVGSKCILNINQTISQAGTLTVRTGKNLVVAGLLINIDSTGSADTIKVKRLYRGTATTQAQIVNALGQPFIRHYQEEVEIEVSKPVEAYHSKQKENNPFHFTINPYPKVTHEEGQYSIFSAKILFEGSISSELLIQYWHLNHTGNSISGTLTDPQNSLAASLNIINLPIDIGGGTFVPYMYAMGEGTKFSGTMTDQEIRIRVEGNTTVGSHAFVSDIVAIRTQ